MISERKILILKTGNTIKSLLDTGKDFEHWFTHHSGLCKAKFMVRSLHLKEPLVDLRQVAGIVITGSPAYVTDKETWNFTGAEYVKRAHKSGIPILGVCYGHQLLAWAFGGKVDFNVEGRKIGTIPIKLTESAKDDLLFGDLPDGFDVNVSHQQSVVRLPPDAVTLAVDGSDILQAFKLGEKTWGIQFHPEFSKEIIREYIQARATEIIEEGLDPDKLSDRASNTPNSTILFQKFCRLAMNMRNC